MVGGAHDAILFHLLDQLGGTVITDLQVALNERGARLPLSGDEGDGLIVKGVFTVGITADRSGNGRRLVFDWLGHFIEISRLALLAQESNHRLDLLIGNEGAVNTGDPPAARHIKQVALSQ